MTRVVIVHPFDPLGTKVGGIETLARSMIRNAPGDIRVDVLGVTENPHDRPVERWTEFHLGGRAARLYPVFCVENSNQRTLVPLFLRFPLAMMRVDVDVSDAVLVFHRWEPAVFRRHGCLGRVLCMHADPREWLGKGSEVRWRFAPGLFRALEGYLLPTLDRVWVVSRGGLESYQQRFPNSAGRFSFLPTWYEPDVFRLASSDDRARLRESLLRERRWPENSKIVLFAGRMEAQKDPLLAVEAIVQASRSRPDIRGLFVGKGGLRETAEKAIADAGMSDVVAFVDPVSPERLAEIMNACDLFLLTSCFEGMPVIVSEAQACGLPVVSTAAGEVPRMVRAGTTGEIVDASADALAQAIAGACASRGDDVREACARNAETHRAGRVVGDFYAALRDIAAVRNPV